MNRPSGYFFDPITLGIHVPENVFKEEKYSDDFSIIEETIFIHELTHYLQFFGSCFGYIYLFTFQIFTKHSLTILKHLGQIENLKCPVSFNYPVNLEEVFHSSEEALFVLKNLNAERYFTEELYGWSYPMFLIDPVRTKDGAVSKTFPLILVQKDKSTYGVTGESILENQASWNQINYLNSAYPNRYEDIIKQLTKNQDSEINGRYHGINSWLNIFNIGHLSDILYFIILNQPQWDVLEKRGDYTLVHSLRSILKKAVIFKDIPFPKNDNETTELILFICKETRLSNPYTNLEELKQYLIALTSEKYKEDPDWILNWVPLQIVDWILNNRTLAISWSKNPMYLLKKIPIINLFFDHSLNLPSYLNIPENLENPTKKYLGSSTVRYLVYNIMTQESFNCPTWIYKRPSYCKSCESCKGILPSKSIGSDCPVLNIINELGISNLKTI